MHVPTLAINYWPPDCSPRLLQRFAAAQYAVQVVENETYLGLRTHRKHKSRRGAVRGQSGRRKNLIKVHGFTHPAQTHVSPREGDLAAVLEPSLNHRSLAIVQGSLTHFEMKRVFVFPIWSMPTLLGRKRSLVAQVSVPVGSNEPSPSTPPAFSSKSCSYHSKQLL